MKKDAEFMIVNRRTGKALGVTGSENGQGVDQRSPQGTDAQIWRKIETGGGIKLENKAAGKVLDVMMGGTQDGTWAQIWADAEGESQFWRFAGGMYKKLVHVASGKVLDIADMSDEEGAHAQIWTDLGGENQQWKLVVTEEEVLGAQAVPAAEARAAGTGQPQEKVREKAREKASAGASDPKLQDKTQAAPKTETKTVTKAGKKPGPRKKTAARTKTTAAKKPVAAGEKKPASKRPGGTKGAVKTTQAPGAEGPGGTAAKGEKESIQG